MSGWPDVTPILVDRADVQRPGIESFARGQANRKPLPHLHGIPFRLHAASARERITAEQQKTYCTHVGYARPDADIRRDDVVTGVVRADGTVDPGEYRVTARLPPSLPHHLKLALEEIQRG